MRTKHLNSYIIMEKIYTIMKFLQHYLQQSFSLTKNRFEDIPRHEWR